MIVRSRPLLTLGDVVVSMPPCGRSDCAYALYLAQGPAHLPHDVYHCGQALYARIIAVSGEHSLEARRMRAVLRLPETASWQ